ncbi:unnamed protein product, partial [marine sediment metagenome]
GWLYSQKGAERLFQTQAQYRWADKFSLLDSEEKITNVLNEYNLGYIVSPDGRAKGQKEITLGTEEELPAEEFWKIKMKRYIDECHSKSELKQIAAMLVDIAATRQCVIKGLVKDTLDNMHSHLDYRRESAP